MAHRILCPLMIYSHYRSFCAIWGKEKPPRKHVDEMKQISWSDLTEVMNTLPDCLISRFTSFIDSCCLFDGIWRRLNWTSISILSVSVSRYVTRIRNLASITDASSDCFYANQRDTANELSVIGYVIARTVSVCRLTVGMGEIVGWYWILFRTRVV